MPAPTVDPDQSSLADYDAILKATQPVKPARNAFVRAMRKVYNPLGFSKGYNFVLFFIFGGALLGFVLARFMYLDFDGQFCANKGSNSAAPGECYYYTRGHWKVGIKLHLFTILPASFLAIFQFVPVIRHKATLYHRMMGYIIITLVLISIVGALMIARVSFGGGLDTQAAVGFLAVISIVSLFMSYVNIKRLQIDQHRAWMLRAWFYLASIVTMRLIMIIAATIISNDQYYTVRPCAELLFIYEDNRNLTLKMYPGCQAYFDGSNPNQQALVQAKMTGQAPQVGAALGTAFGMSFWLAIALHAIGVEIYLSLTTAESERLRNVSYERQLEAGHKNPGSAGLVAEKFGDMKPWTPT